MKLCPTCGGSPGKRMWLAVGMPHEDKPINVVMCEDPLHDAADRVGEMQDALDELLAVIDTIRSEHQALSAQLAGPMDPRFRAGVNHDCDRAYMVLSNMASAERKARSALPEVPR